MAESPLAGRSEAVAVWTGKQMLVWGGDGVAGSHSDGAGYDPASDTWRPIPPAPVSGRVSRGAWTGRELVVWGGRAGQEVLADGAAYDPAGNSWRMLPGAPLAARARHTMTWTDRELLVWGGAAGSTAFSDGAAFDPVTFRWRSLGAAPLAARGGHVAAWTGSYLLVWGGAEGGEARADGAIYDPAADTWSPMAPSPLSGRVGAAAVWTGHELLVWGGGSQSGHRNDGAAYDLTRNEWRTLPPGPLSPRGGQAATWTSRHLVVWGGGDKSSLGDGARYSADSDVWQPLPPAPVSPRAHPSWAWTGEELVVWGGGVGGGGRLEPRRRRFSSTSCRRRPLPPLIGPGNWRPRERPLTPPEPRATASRTRREPPRFRPLAVANVERRSPRMVRVTLAGHELQGFTTDLPAASVRLLLPPVGGQLVLPSWNGNEFLLPGGRRPTIRTFTPRRFDPEALELDLEIVVHGRGAASAWAEAAEPGAPAAVSGPGRGFAIDTSASAFVLGGDETAIPAMSQLLEALPQDKRVEVCIEVADPAARLPLPEHPAAIVQWLDLPEGSPPGDTLEAAVRGLRIAPDARVWVAGEAAAVQRIRRHLFDERRLPRPQVSVRGYWKHGRSGDQDDDRPD